jgi:uncharacterized protein YuzB (UPF0349 family)
MRPIIEFCVANMSLGTDQIKSKLEQNPDYDVIEYGCLGNCGQCFYAPYALVNGEMIAAVTPDELFDKIQEAIASLDDPYAWLDEEEDG